MVETKGISSLSTTKNTIKVYRNPSYFFHMIFFFYFEKVLKMDKIKGNAKCEFVKPWTISAYTIK